MTMHPADERIDELVSRSRRTETRLTQLLKHLGISPTTTQIQWIPVEGQENCPGTLRVPTPNVSLKELLATIPETVPTGSYIPVWHESTALCALLVTHP